LLLLLLLLGLSSPSESDSKKSTIIPKGPQEFLVFPQKLHVSHVSSVAYLNKKSGRVVNIQRNASFPFTTPRASIIKVLPAAHTFTAVSVLALFDK
jgi:hypothetical protein